MLLASIRHRIGRFFFENGLFIVALGIDNNV
jgi:hypothetical protein